MNADTSVATTVSTREKAALTVSGGIVLATAIYWLVQITDAIETLKLAYGGG